VFGGRGQSVVCYQSQQRPEAHAMAPSVVSEIHAQRQLQITRIEGAVHPSKRRILLRGPGRTCCSGSSKRSGIVDRIKLRMVERVVSLQTELHDELVFDWDVFE